MSIDPSTYNTIVNVRNFPDEMTEEDLRNLFSKYGTVTRCQIMVSDNAEVGRFAYAAFEDPDAAEDAIIELNCQELAKGRRIYLRRTHAKIIRQPKEKKNPVRLNVENANRCEIFVNHLYPTINEHDLCRLFNDFGIITSAKIIMENGRSKGYGFVSFATQEAANEAVTKMNGHNVFGERIGVALATGTDRNKNKMASGFAGRLDEHRRVGTNLASTSSEHFDEIEELSRVFNDTF